MYLTVEDAKKHLNIDATFTDDDAYISDLIDVAEDAVQHHIDRPLAEIETAPGKLPPAVLHAVRFLVGQLYAHREPAAFASAVEIPYTYSYLISLYKRYTIA